MGLRRRLLPSHLDRLICNLCAEKPWTLRDLAALLDRSPVYLQNTAVKRLLQQGRLRFAHPDEPNHPRQAYITERKTAPSPPSPEPEISIGFND